MIKGILDYGQNRFNQFMDLVKNLNVLDELYVIFLELQLRVLQLLQV
jgi:hypothetical protein